MRRFSCLLLALPLALLFACVRPDAGGAAPAVGGQDAPWRIRFLEAAVVQGDRVLLGEVAVPMGDMPAGMWDDLARRELWPSPAGQGKAVNMTRPRLQEAVMRTMKDLAPYCLFPGSMALQRGGVLVGKEAVQQLAAKELSPLLASLPGEAALTDYRLPSQVFLEHAGQELVLEAPRKVAAGRLSLRLLVREMDGVVKQKLTGSVFIDCWADVPCAAVGMNRDDLLEHTKVTFKRMNLASLRGRPWDGLGGPWRLTRPISVEQVIYQHDVTHVPTVRKGSIVTVLYEGKTVRLSLQAEAMADGGAGETIPVRNLQSKRELYAQIRDGSTVTVTASP